MCARCRGKTRLAKWYAPYTVRQPAHPTPNLADHSLRTRRRSSLRARYCSPPTITLSPTPKLTTGSRTSPQVHRLVAPRDQKHQSNFVEFRTTRIVYRRYAGLFFCVCVDASDNELAYLEAIHFFVEVLDTFFGNVCELDLVFNFYKVRSVLAKDVGNVLIQAKVYAILDEVFLAGEIQETSRPVVLGRLQQLYTQE